MQFIVFLTSTLVLTLISAHVEANSQIKIKLPTLSPKTLSSEVIVELPLGKLQGEERKSYKGKPLYAFEGVPFAAPPIGQFRFREPQEVESWTGTKVVKKTIKCIQVGDYTTGPSSPYKVEGVEDCLYLNIYTSSLNQTANLPVIVFIQGEGMTNRPDGFTNSPDYMLDEDVVHVSMNYRSGAPLGFLSTEDDVVPGNMGMLDQTMALRFIRKYIKLFGGDPNSVTITEDSLAIGSVHFHMLSPLSKGLFHKGVSHSGTMLNAWALAKNSREQAEKLAEALDCSRSSLREAVECLRTKPAADIVAPFRHSHSFKPSSLSFGVVIDSWAKNPSLPDHPFKLIQQGKVHNVPWIIGLTNSVGLSPSANYYNDSMLEKIDTHWNEIMPHLLIYDHTVEKSLHDSVSQKIRHYYLAKKRVTKETFMDFVQIVTDRLYVGDIVKTVKLHLKHLVKPKIQLYMFSYHGANSLFNLRTQTKEDFGAAFMDDVQYVLRNSYVDSATTKNDINMMILMVKMIVHFAQNGFVNIGEFEWPKVTREELHRLHIRGPNNLKIDRQVFTNSSFWESLPIRENEKLFLV